MIDLHTHSTASDGTLSPTDLVRLAKKTGVEVLALTDHDTISGLAEAQGEARRVGLDFIPGIEISAEYAPGTMHMLGYFVDPADAGLAERLSWLREGRDGRNAVILKKLARLGLPIEYDEVARLAGGESVGRPHIARAMVAKGYAATFEEAFDRYLGKGAAAYVERPRMTPEASIAEIRNAGGLAVLAHPRTLELDEKRLRQLVGELAGHGLTGMEVYYFEHTAKETRLYEKIAKESGLLPTGGSDYHGPDMFGSELGRGRGDMDVPRSFADALMAMHRASHGKKV